MRKVYKKSILILLPQNRCISKAWSSIDQTSRHRRHIYDPSCILCPSRRNVHICLHIHRGHSWCHRIYYYISVREVLDHRHILSNRFRLVFLLERQIKIPKSNQFNRFWTDFLKDLSHIFHSDTRYRTFRQYSQRFHNHNRFRMDNRP